MLFLFLGMVYNRGVGKAREAPYALTPYVLGYGLGFLSDFAHTRIFSNRPVGDNIHPYTIGYIKGVYNMKVGQIPDFLAHLTPKSPVPIFKGTTGIGKTMAVKLGAQRLGRKMAAIPPLSTMLPEDANGVPIPQIETVKFMPPDFWRVGKNTLMFLDEFNLATPDVMSTLCSVLWPLADGTRRVGSFALPEDLLVVAAAMPPSPGSPSRPLPDFLRSRFRMINIEAHVDDWIPWAIGAGVESTIVSFIKQRPELLAPKPPEDHSDMSFPTPRAWARLSFVIMVEKQTGWMLSESASGMVGAGAAGEYITYRQNMNVLPDPIKVLEGEIKFPKRADIACATAVSCIQAVLNDAELVPHWLEQSLEWPADYVIGLQFTAIARVDSQKRVDLGLDLPNITAKYPKWLKKYSQMIHNIQTS